MSPVSVIPVVAVLLLAFCFMGFLVRVARLRGFEPEAGRYASIDGLRGYLALFVFVYHSCMWYFFIQTGEWKVPPSNLYTSFGEGGVALFFMITGFLFFLRILNAKHRPIDWMRLYVARFMRLAPLYFFAIGVVFVGVAVGSNFTVHGSPRTLVVNGLYWLGLGLLPTPDLNGLDQTWMMVAGVTWSLRYEWLFYLSLPVYAMFFKLEFPARYKILGVIGLTGLLASSVLSGRYYCPFLFACGAVAAVLVRFPAFRAFSSSTYSSFMVLGLLTVASLGFSSVYKPMPMLLLGAAFSMVAGGNGLFGALLHPFSRALGELAYGIYLLHGLFLYFILKFVVGFEILRGLSPFGYWCVIVALVPLVVTVCVVAHKVIEKPAMHSADAVAARVRGFLAGRLVSP